jgi:tetratricopeptide (TPR) repeat protein
MQFSVEQAWELGRQAYSRKEYSVALEYFRLVLTENPDFADVRHVAGLCLSFLGRPEEALEQFEEALNINPAYVEAHINRALVLHELGLYDEAQRSFNQAARHEIQQEGRFPAAATARLANAHAGVGDLYMEIPAPAEAAIQYRAALELRPAFHDIRNKLAAALLALDWPEEAAMELQRVIDANPRFVAARLNLGLAYFRLGRRGDAAEQWQAAAEIQPENPQVRAYLALLEQPRIDGGPPIDG